MVFFGTISIDIFVDFLIAIALGALIGMEREMDQQQSKIKEFAGVRTFILITLFGALVAFISKTVESSLIFVALAFFGFIIFVTTSYVVTVFYHKKIGATTQMTALLAFVLGMMCILEMIGLAVTITILITIFLALKQVLHKFALQINRQELYATLEFALISLVILPFLPNKAYGPLGVFNPYNIWLMVVFISGISFVGYILMKWKGVEKGLGITGFLGGLISSTSVATSMANESKRTYLAKPFVFAAVVASTTMFFRVVFITYILNKELVLSLIIPLGAMALVGLFSVSYIWRGKIKKIPKLKLSSPFTLVPALKFAVFYALVLFVTKAAQTFYGSSGVYVAAILAGLVDLNAITISMATLSLSGVIPVQTSVIAITFAILSNNFIKIFIGYFFGNREFSRLTTVIYAAMLVVGILAIMLL
ncbi:MgtC/SapB family protein [Candidatus Woesearchaeota archaeon]|nr:MgtC/SapB family protein [Candidatus Woesearchaeota archaeon]